MMSSSPKMMEELATAPAPSAEQGASPAHCRTPDGGGHAAGVRRCALGHIPSGPCAASNLPRLGRTLGLCKLPIVNGLRELYTQQGNVDLSHPRRLPFESHRD